MDRRWVVKIYYTDGTTETHYYASEQRAKEVERNYRNAFGNQVQYTSVYKEFRL